jgi:hypothetical protein
VHLILIGTLKVFNLGTALFAIEIQKLERRGMDGESQ